MSNPQLEAQQAYQTYTHLYQVASTLNTQAKTDPSKAEAAQQANQQAHTAYANYQAAWSKAYQEHNRQSAEAQTATQALAAQPAVAAAPAVSVSQNPNALASLYSSALTNPAAGLSALSAGLPGAAGAASVAAATPAPTAQLSTTQLASLFPGATPAATSTPAAAPNPLSALPGLSGLPGTLPTPSPSSLPTGATATPAAAAAANPLSAIGAMPGIQQMIAQQMQQGIVQAALLAQQLNKNSEKKETKTNESSGTKRSYEESKSSNYNQRHNNYNNQNSYDGQDNYNQNSNYYNKGNNYRNQNYDQNTDQNSKGSYDRFGNYIKNQEHGSAHSRLGGRFHNNSSNYEEGGGQGASEQGQGQSQFQKPENKDYTKMSTDTVYVDGLPADVHRSTISDFFSQVGPLRSTGRTETSGVGRLFIFLDEAKLCNGAASVTFQNAEDAENCCSLLQGKSFPVPKKALEDAQNNSKNRGDKEGDSLRRERSALGDNDSDRSYNSSDEEDDDRDYKRRRRNSSESASQMKERTLVNDPSVVVQDALSKLPTDQPMTAEMRQRPWMKFDDKNYWVMMGKLTIRMATLGERDPIGEKRQKMGLPHQNSEAARHLNSTRGRGGFGTRGHHEGGTYPTRGRGRGGGHYDNSYDNSHRGGYNTNYDNSGRGSYRGRGGYDNSRGSYRGGYDNSRGSYRGGRGGYDNSRGGYRGRGGYDNSRGSYRGRGGYDNSYQKPSMEETQTDRFGNVIRGSYRGATARNNYMKPAHHKPL